MDLRQLRYFVEVIEHRSISAAAAHLRIAQPAITRSLQQLADGLGVKLLERHARGMRPTEAGERLYTHARRLLLDVEEIERDVIDTEKAPAGHVVVACTPAFGSVILPPALIRLRERFPKIQVSMREGFGDTVYKWILEGECDVAILANPRPTAMISIWHTWQQQMRVAVPAHDIPPHFEELIKPSYRIADLERMPLILPSRETSHRMIVEAAVVAEGHALDVAYEVDGITSIIEMVARSLGFSVLLETAMLQGVRTGQIRTRPFDPPTMQGEMAIATPSARVPTRATRAFIPLVKSAIDDALVGWRTG